VNRHLGPLPRIAGAALAIAAAATFSIAGAAAAQAGEQHAALGSSPQLQTQLHTDGYGIGGLSVSVQESVSGQESGQDSVQKSVQESVQIDIQKPGH